MIDLDFLNLTTEAAIDKLKAEDPYPQGTEFGFKLASEEQHAGLHVREDGVVEIYAGSARILLDPETGSIVLSGNQILEQAHKIEQTATTLSWENQPLRVEWKTVLRAMVAQSPDILDSLFVLRSPLVQAGATAEPLSNFITQEKLYNTVPEGKGLLGSLKGLLNNGT